MFYSIVIFFFYVKDTCAVEELELQEKKTREEKEKRTKLMVKIAVQKLKKELEYLPGNDDAQNVMRKDLVKKLGFTVQQTVKAIVDGKHPTKEMVKEFIDRRKKPASTKSPNNQKSDDNRRQYVDAVLKACKAASACGDADCQENWSTQASFSDSH